MELLNRRCFGFDILPVGSTLLTNQQPLLPNVMLMSGRAVCEVATSGPLHLAVG